MLEIKEEVPQNVAVIEIVERAVTETVHGKTVRNAERIGGKRDGKNVRERDERNDEEKDEKNGGKRDEKNDGTVERMNPVDEVLLMTGKKMTVHADGNLITFRQK